MAVGIVGRDAEVVTAAGFPDVVGRGPAALLIEGEAGIGKTIIWREGIAAAADSGCRVLSTRPVEVETKLSYTGLADLLGEELEISGVELPSPQRHAFEIALLRADEGADVDHRALSMAALSVVRSIASSMPVVIAVDDAQWLDGPTARVLGFVIRRLRDEPIGVLGTIRVQGDDLVPRWLAGSLADERLQVMRVGALSVGALHHVLHQQLGSSFNRSLLVRLHRASAGNPFVALEMGRAYQRRGEDLRPGEALPVPDNVRDLVHERLAGLPARARKTLLVVSAMAQPTLQLVRRAADRPQLVDVDLERIVEAGVVELEGERIRFTHPLLASVPYSEASASERRRVHQRLANIVVDPEEQARHLALGSSGPNVDVAAALDGAAQQARRRGAPDAAAELSHLARELTPIDRVDDMVLRTVETAEYRFAAGDVEGARSLLEDQVATLGPGPTRANALRQLATVRYWQDGFDAAAGLILEAESQMGDDPWLRATIGEALAYVALQRGETVFADERARDALAIAERLDDFGLLARLLTDIGFTGFLLGRGIDTDIWERALALESFTDDDPPERRPSVTLSALYGWSGDLDNARERLDVAAHRCADRGDDQALPIIAFYRVSLERFCGHWELASEIASDVLREAEGLASDTLLGYVLSSKAMLDAGLGNIDSARASGQRGLALAQRAGAAPAVLFNLSALGFAELSEGRPAAAHGFLGPLADAARATGTVEPTVYQFLPDEIEALIALGDLESAEPHIAWLETQGWALDRPWALAAGGRCRALLLAARGDLVGAEKAVTEALTQNERLPVPFELARTLLCMGQVQRRAKKKRVARGSLERALSIFESLPAPLWAEKARLEIARIGGRPPTSSSLTESESRVAELVSAGRTNREVASALFMSVNTVEAHLKRIYRKLGIRSRTELSHRMSGDGSPPGSPPVGTV